MTGAAVRPLRFEWDAELERWEWTGSIPGPAGTAELELSVPNVGTVCVAAFDMVCCSPVRVTLDPAALQSAEPLVWFDESAVATFTESWGSPVDVAAANHRLFDSDFRWGRIARLAADCDRLSGFRSAVAAAELLLLVLEEADDTPYHRAAGIVHCVASSLLPAILQGRTVAIPTAVPAVAQQTGSSLLAAHLSRHHPLEPYLLAALPLATRLGSANLGSCTSAAAPCRAPLAPAIRPKTTQLSWAGGSCEVVDDFAAVGLRKTEADVTIDARSLRSHAQRLWIELFDADRQLVAARIVDLGPHASATHHVRIEDRRLPARIRAGQNPYLAEFPGRSPIEILRTSIQLGRGALADQLIEPAAAAAMWIEASVGFRSVEAFARCAASLELAARSLVTAGDCDAAAGARCESSVWSSLAGADYGVPTAPVNFAWQACRD